MWPTTNPITGNLCANATAEHRGIKNNKDVTESAAMLLL